MDRMIYVAMSGARQTLIAQAANSHNMANVSTVGFRSDLSQFRAMPVFGDGLPTRVYALAERPGVDFAPGTLRTTGRTLDVAVNGDGWIAVQAADGSEAYTRAGDLRVSSTGGVLETGAGFPVLGNGGPIAVPPFDKLEIGTDGTISIRPLGQGAGGLAEVDRVKLVNPDPSGLKKGADGLFRSGPGGSPADAGVTLVSGALEDSNVRIADALVRMISLARRFEAQVKMMQTANQNETAATEMLRIA